MCGINGIVRLSATAPPVDRDVLLRTRDAMALRGPDGMGAWVADDGSVGLGHRRLAIIDLTDTGLQPMAHAGGRYRLVFNGEIYNYRELKQGLERDGATFVSTSDSEVILALFEREGEAAFRKLRGMFALAIWDATARRLTLARDPYGIKPLYIAEGGGWLQFASQVKALEAGGHVGRGVDLAAVAEFLMWGSVPEPRTIRSGVRALPAGHVLAVDDGRVGEPRSYRDVGRIDTAPCGGVREALEDTVRAHLVADVPVAVFLSAGIDSSLIAALARRVAGEPPTTLTMRFADFAGSEADEGPGAAAIARALGTRHVERVLTRDDLRGLWPKVLSAMDQPSIDGFNTYVVSRVAHEAGFKVVLSGLGGDELFGGYGTFRDVPRQAAIARRLAAIPGAPSAWRAVTRVVGARPKFAGVLAHGTSVPGAYFVRRGLYLPEELDGVLGSEAAAFALAEAGPVDAARRAGTGARDPWEEIHLLESTLYMRNQLLRDSDWASMAHSLELRVPFVDIVLRDQMAGLSFQPARSGGKAAVARAAAPELPAAVFVRPKTGFGIPAAHALAADGRPPGHGGAGARGLALGVLEAFGIATNPQVASGG